MAKSSKKKTRKKSASTKIAISAKTIQHLIHEAFSARDNSYSPYSGFKVGAAILTSDDMVFSGTNIENASFGGTVCAERVAAWKAVSEGVRFPIKAVAVVTREKEIWPPCGMCRQVLAEFCDPESLIITANSTEDYNIYRFAELQPLAFTPDFLRK